MATKGGPVESEFKSKRAGTIHLERFIRRDQHRTVSLLVKADTGKTMVLARNGRSSRSAPATDP